MDVKDWLQRRKRFVLLTIGIQGVITVYFLLEEFCFMSIGTPDTASYCMAPEAKVLASILMLPISMSIAWMALYVQHHLSTVREER